MGSFGGKPSLFTMATNTNIENLRNKHKNIENESKEETNIEVMAINNNNRDDIVTEIKGELLEEMKNKNEELLLEINKLKTELKDLSMSKHKAGDSVHNEWPKLDIKDRANLRKKLAKEIKDHHSK